METDAPCRPMPALTPAQRYYLEVNGYVVVPGVLTPDECDAGIDAMHQLRAELLAAGGAKANARVRGAFLIGDRPWHAFIGNILAAAPAATAYACHPRLVGMAEELIGGEARIVECNGHVNTRNPHEKPGDAPEYSLHYGIDTHFAGHTGPNGLYHCSFVKTLTNLTDLGPDDGGTVCIAGSHKLTGGTIDKDIIAASKADPSLVHQVVAPAGSTLLFAETTIHGKGRHTSDRERVLLITGYGASMFPYWETDPIPPEFMNKIPKSLETLFKGRANWNRGARYRPTLGSPVDDRAYAAVPWE
jgi:hypothetical protein